MTPFRPVGSQARWKTLHELLQRRSVDDTVTYAEMGAALDLDPDKDRHAIQMALRRAAQEYQQRDLRAITPVPNVGYRVVEAREHVTLAQRQQKRAGTALVRGRDVVTHVDMNGLDPQMQRIVGAVAQAFRLQLDFMNRLDVRQKRVEEAVAAMAPQIERTDEEVRQLRDRLDRLEGRTEQQE